MPHLLGTETMLKGCHSQQREWLPFKLECSNWNVRQGTPKRNSEEVKEEMNELTRPTTHWNVRLDATLAARVELAMWDPVLRKPKYGSRKLLIEHLLIKWLQEEAVKATGVSHVG